MNEINTPILQKNDSHDSTSKTSWFSSVSLTNGKFCQKWIPGKIHLISTLILGLAFLLCIFMMNYDFMYISDDCSYGLALVPNEISDLNKPVAKLSTIQNAWVYTTLDRYRPIVHFWTRLFTGVWPKLIFNLCNTLILGILALLTLKLAKARYKGTFAEYSILLTLIFLILCKGESYLWCAGSLNYLWTGAATLFFCLLRKKILENSKLCSTILFSVMAFVIGWMQESFSVPLCFAIGIYSLIHIKQLTVKQSLFYGCYGLGAILLCLVASHRLEYDTGSPTLISLILTQIKIFIAVKAVWILCIIFFLTRQKLEFIKRNQFELLIILGSYLLISYVGFNGERCLWAANLFSIVIIMREIKPKKNLVFLTTTILVLLMPILLYLGSQIRASSLQCIQLYKASTDGVSCHNRVFCGPFARFFHQGIYTWQRRSGHNISFSHYYGKGIPLCALSKEMYEGLYLKDRICTPANRHPSVTEYYTTPSLNAFVRPISLEGAAQLKNSKVELVYLLKNDLISNLKRELSVRISPTVPDTSNPIILQTSHGAYLLVAKQYPNEDAALTEIRLSR